MTVSSDLPDWITSVGSPSNVIFSAFITAFGQVDINVAQYESVQITIFNSNGIDVVTMPYEFVDPVSTNIIDSGLLSADSVHQPNTDFSPGWSLPVSAPVLRLMNTIGGSIGALVIGRPAASRKVMEFSYYPVRHFQATIPTSTPAGTRIQLPGTDGNSPTPALRDVSNYNGAVSAIVSAGGDIDGQVQFGFRDKAGTRQFVAIFRHPTTTPVQLNIGHPFAFVTWWFVTIGISPASPVAVSLSLLPAEIDG